MFQWQDEFLGVESSSKPDLEVWLSDPAGFVALTVATMTIPLFGGVLLLVAGFLVRRLVGRPADRLAEANADGEPARERTLQWLIRDRLVRLATSGPTPSSSGDGAAALASLDAGRRHRLALLLHHGGLDPLPDGLPVGGSVSPPGSLEIRRRVGPVLSILLLGLASFSLLWGFLSAFSIRLLPEAVGYPQVRHLSIAAFSPCAGTAVTFLFAAWGVRRLLSRDQRLRERWRTAARATSEIVRAGYEDCLEQLAGPALRTLPEAPAIAHGLRVAAMEGLIADG
jgi:hypothetical protein